MRCPHIVDAWLPQRTARLWDCSKENFATFDSFLMKWFSTTLCYSVLADEERMGNEMHLLIVHNNDKCKAQCLAEGIQPEGYHIKPCEVCEMPPISRARATRISQKSHHWEIWAHNCSSYNDNWKCLSNRSWNIPSSSIRLNSVQIKESRATGITTASITGKLRGAAWQPHAVMNLIPLGWDSSVWRAGVECWELLWGQGVLGAGKMKVQCFCRLLILLKEGTAAGVRIRLRLVCLFSHSSSSLLICGLAQLDKATESLPCVSCSRLHSGKKLCRLLPVNCCVL